MISQAVLFVFQCDYCERRLTETQAVATGGVYPNPCLPDGWRLIGSDLVCHIHEIVVRPNLVEE